jgi:hypothetical protein
MAVSSLMLLCGTWQSAALIGMVGAGRVDRFEESNGGNSIIRQLKMRSTFHANLSFTKNAVFLDVRMLQLLITANVFPSLPILVILMMEAIHFCETSVLTKATLRNIREYGIFHSHCRENLKYFIKPFGFKYKIAAMNFPLHKIW